MRLYVKRKSGNGELNLSYEGKYLLDPRYMTKRDLQFYYRYYNMTKKRKHFKKIIIMVLCICFFSYIFIDFNLKTKLIHLRDRFEFIARIDADYNISQAYFIDLPGCRMPYFPVTDDNIIQFMYKPRNFSCKKALMRTSDVGGAVLMLNMNEKEIYDTYEIRDLSNLYCNYTEIRRINDQHNQYLEPVPFQLGYNTHVIIKPGIEFLMVECWPKNNEENIVYKDFHFFVTENVSSNAISSSTNRDELLLDEDDVTKSFSGSNDSHIKNNNNTTSQSSESRLSVMIMGMDSVSHLNFLRQMRSSASYIHNKLNYIEFWGYNKVGDNTYPNLMPVLTGFDEDEVAISCLGPAPKFSSSLYDNCSLIWKRYKEAGFKTVYAEDVGALSLFNWRHSGFKKAPTDYYLRPILLEMERHISYEKRLNVALCMGGRRTADVLLEYIRKLIPMMKHENFFAFFWTVAMTHDLFNMPMLFDEDIKHLLENFDINGILNRTIIFLMSDHGIRWGSFRKTYQGMMEERLPLLIALYPPWFKQKYPEAVSNLEANAKRLSTPYDLHATMLDLLDLRKLSAKQLVKRSAELNDPDTSMPRSISLFLPIPKSRTCENAYIASHWCSCHQHQELPTNDGRVQKAARYIVKLINDRLKDHPQCRVLYLNSITYATVAAPHHKIVKELGVSDYSIDITLRLQTKPGLGLFESTVRMSSYNTALTGTISRINLYSSQSYCIDDYALKMFCYCHR
ncbi:uncharacterized protein LOC111676867 [Lucilia cuprina]|uniref:uncharacterized protein LOC111676867 n=1 Tax=Lucilia cuprina TaxID=7375 RepID=UPI001F05E640|nr:uncharacterized protein LOC111676867 [Lucilia cuprina]